MLKSLSVKVFAFILSTVCFVACIEPFDANFNTNLRLVVIEGTLSNLENETFVNIREAIPSGASSSLFRSLKDVKVQIVENDNSRIDFEEIESGYFKAPAGFKGITGNSYSLEFTTNDGNRYKSANEELLPVASIKKVYQTTEDEGPIVAEKAIPGNTIYIDTDDPVGIGNNYLWSWSLFEREYVCTTCDAGYYYTDPLPAGRCIEDAFLKRRGVIYDYLCETPCWKILRSETVNTQSDQFVDGLTIQGREIAKIPYYNEKGGLIEIKQQSISADGYAYLKLLVGQGQNTGGLADTPPAALVGNVKSLDKDEVVTGYFLVSGMSKTRYWIDRSDMLARGFRPFGLLGGREIRQEPAPLGSTDRPPFSPCLVSPSRTNSKPLGFLFD